MFGKCIKIDGHKDAVTIDVRKLSNAELSNIINQHPKQKISTIKEYLDAKSKVDYDFTISSENNKETEDILKNLRYNMILSDWTVSNPDIEGGFSTILESSFINTSKKEKYILTFTDVWPVHEERRS